MTRSAIILVFLALCTWALPAHAQVHSGAAYSLYADPRPRLAGDVLTIILAERTSAQRASEWERNANSRLGGGSNLDGGTDLTGRFALDASFNRESLSSNQSVQRDLLSGTLTALITGVDSTSGNLLVAGERRLNVNGETHVMKVRGVVRPLDVTYDNTVLSFQIANADIEYRRAGFHRRFIKPGAVARIGVGLVLGAASFFAIQQGMGALANQ
ncbi:MAG: flagellar basal body L-ring protein FlgH [Bacteroidota bacterium]